MRRISPFIAVIDPHSGMSVPAVFYVNEGLESALDEGSKDQLQRVATLPGVLGAAIAMPDAHIGYGFPIGGVAAFDAEKGIISPGGIGFDINCGIRLLATDIPVSEVKLVLPRLFDLLTARVPTGSGRDSSLRLTHTQLDEVFVQGASWALRNGYGTEHDIAVTEENGCLQGAVLSAVSHRAKDRGASQLGTLGSGNHFLELQAVDELFSHEAAAAYGLKQGTLAVLIHCGSRGVGHQVCSDSLRAMADEYPEEFAALPDKNLLYAPISSPLGQAYLGAMRAAANYAWANRQVIAHIARTTLLELFPKASVTQVYDVSHNIAKFETHTLPFSGEEKTVCVHRKGATRSFPPGHKDIPLQYVHVGQPVLVPGSMGTSSWVLAGAQGALTHTFGSCCHGAGRVLSRTKALETLDGHRVKQELGERGIHVCAHSTKGLAEEAPEAYKDVDEVIAVVAGAGLATPVARLTPLGVLKG